MSDTALSPGEIEALRDATRDVTAASIDTVELAASDRQAKRRLPALAAKLDVVLKRQRRALSQALRTPCECSFDAPEVAGPMMMAQEVTGWLMGAMVRLADSQEPLLWIGTPAPLAYHLIEVAFGGTAGSPGPRPSRTQLTPLERDTLAPLLQAAADGVVSGLNLAQAGALEVSPTGYPITFGGLRTQESGILLHLQVPVGSEQMRMGLVLAPKALEWTGASASGRQARVESAADAMMAHVNNALVQLVATLGGTSVTVAELMELKVGQVIWLEHTQSQPIALSLEGQTKFTAMPMQRAGAVGVQIIERVL